MRVLAVHYFAPPMRTVPAFRFHAILSRWANQASIFLITSHLVDQFAQESQLLLSDVATFQMPTRDLRARSGASQAHQPTSQKTAWWYQWLARCYHAFPFVLFTGDGGWTYIQAAYAQGAQLVEAEEITHLFSSYRPWADHLICYRLKKKYPQLIWIADFRDRAVDPVRNDVWWPWLQAQFQRYILRKADVVTAVSEGQAAHFQQYHPQVQVLRNGLRTLPPSKGTKPTSPCFTLSYTGAIYPSLQSADLLWEVLQELLRTQQISAQDLCIQYAGKDGLYWSTWLEEFGLQTYLMDRGLVSLSEAEEIQQNSQLNILLSWSRPGYTGIMTAKLGSYLSAGRPILTFVNGPNDPELIAAIEETHAGYVFAESGTKQRARLRKILLEAYAEWSKTQSVAWQSKVTALQTYTWDAQFDKFYQTL